MAFGHGGHAPNYKRTMLFIDGTNFLARLGEAAGIPIDAQRPTADVLRVARHLIDGLVRGESGVVVQRRYWCGSYTGNDEDRDRIAGDLHDWNFEPVLLKAYQRREKGVDMALAINLLVNAFHRNLDVGWLVAGDADYVQLVQEAKRYGCVIKVMAFEKHGLAPSLKLASDEFRDLDQFLTNAINADTTFRGWINKLKEELEISGNSRKR